MTIIRFQYFVNIGSNMKISIKKGLIAIIRYNPLILMVGGTGFEPATSTV